jgi:Protein of unknown function (DUF3606)
MVDDLTKKAPQDASKVNVNEPYEVNWWCSKWGCTPAQLKACVARVGVMAKDVAKCLGK